MIPLEVAQGSAPTALPQSPWHARCHFELSSMLLAQQIQVLWLLSYYIPETESGLIRLEVEQGATPPSTALSHMRCLASQRHLQQRYFAATFLKWRQGLTALLLRRYD